MDQTEIWKHATYLTQAPVKFGNPDRAKEYHAEFSKAMKAPGLMEQVSNHIQSGGSLETTASKLVNPWEKSNALKEELQAEVLLGLKKGNLLGYGFSTPRKMEDSPREVPKEIWDYKIVWDRNRIEGRGLVVEDVRIVRFEDVSNARQQNAPAPTETRRKGRPSRRVQIQEAFRALDSTGEIDYSQPMTSAVPTIQTWLLKHPIYSKQGDRGLGQQAITRTISDLFKDKKERKSKV